MAKSSLALTLGNISIRQLDGLFSLNDLHRAAGGETKHQPHEFLRIEQTKALVAELSNSGDSRNYLETKRGKFGGTYACRELVIAYAAWISATFHLKVIRVFLDSVQPDIERATITPAQAQHLRELVDLVVASDKQSYPETWSRLHRKMHVNSYLALRQDQFNEACQYLRAKMDDQSMGALLQKHFPQAALKPPVSMAALPAPEPVTAATLVSLLMGDCLSERAVLDIALAASVTLFKKAVSKPNGFGDQVARKIDSRLPQADLHAILVAASMEMNMRVVGAKMELEKVE